MSFNKPPETPRQSDNSDLANLAKGMQTSEIAVGIPIRQGFARAAAAAAAIGMFVIAALVIATWTRSGIAWVAAAMLLTFGYYLNRYVEQGIDVWVHDAGRLIDLMELRIQADIDGNGRIGPPKPAGPERYIRVDLWRHSPGGSTSTADYLDLPMSNEQYQLLAAKINMWGGKIRVKQLTEGPGAIFGQGELDNLLAVMVKAELAYKQDQDVANSPYVLTDAGKKVFGVSSGEVSPEFDNLPCPTNGRVAGG